MVDNRYLKSSAPAGGASASVSRITTFKGLCLHTTNDSGYVADGQNFEISPEGRLRTASIPELFKDTGKAPLALFAYGGYLYMLYEDSDNGRAYIVRYNEKDKSEKSFYYDVSDDYSGALRSFAVYSDWTGGSDIINGEYEKKLVIFPDKKELPFTASSGASIKSLARYRITRKVTTKTETVAITYNSGWSQSENGDYIFTDEDDYDGKSVDVSTSHSESFYGYQKTAEAPDDIDHPPRISVSYARQDVYSSDGSFSHTALIKTTVTVSEKETFSTKAETGAVPDASQVTAFNTRLFGVNGSKVFASAAGNIVDYELDTATDFDENNAWYCATDYADFTDLFAFDGRVTLLSPDGLYQLYGTKNPFRVREISAVGTSWRGAFGITENILFYTNKDGVYAFTGAYPENISESMLSKSIFSSAQKAIGAAGDGRYYLNIYPYSAITSEYSGNNQPFFVFDSRTSAWLSLNFSDEANDGAFILSAYGENGVYFATENGVIYRTSDNNRSGVNWFAETPIDYDNTASVKKLTTIQALFRFEESASASISVVFDDGKTAVCGTISKETGVHPLYCVVPFSDHIARKIRIDAVGNVELLSIEQKFTSGGVKHGAG